MRTEVEHLQFGELADGVGQYALAAEAGEDDADDAPVIVERHAGLLAPHVELLVEIPVGTVERGVAVEAPIFAAKRFPDGLQSLIVLDILASLREDDGHFGAVVKLVVGHDKRFALHGLGLEGLLYRSTLAVSGV